MTEYNDKYTCNKCGGYNIIEVCDMADGGIISECSTKCENAVSRIFGLMAFSSLM